MTRVYCTYAQLAERYDSRVLADLVSDSGTATANPATSARVVACLNDASADIDSAVKRGATYTEGQLDQLLASGDFTLIRLCADLTIAHLYASRGGGVPDAVQARVDAANDTLRDLARGVQVLGTAQDSAQTPRPYRPSQTELHRQLPVTTSPLFPDSSQRYV